jgi:hypothetical protein
MVNVAVPVGKTIPGAVVTLVKTTVDVMTVCVEEEGGLEDVFGEGVAGAKEIEEEEEEKVVKVEDGGVKVVRGVGVGKLWLTVEVEVEVFCDVLVLLMMLVLGVVLGMVVIGAGDAVRRPVVVSVTVVTVTGASGRGVRVPPPPEHVTAAGSREIKELSAARAKSAWAIPEGRMIEMAD